MWLDLANRCPSVPTNVTSDLSFSLYILKYNPFKKYLVSSFDMANLVLSISLNKTWEFNFIFIPSVCWSIIGKSSFGRQDNENLDPLALNVNILPLFDITSTSLLSSSFLTISYIIWELIVVAPFSKTLQSPFI